MATNRPPADVRRRNALILALKSAIENRFGESDWKELGYRTGIKDYISRHPRLLRSLSWGDSDYGGHVLDAVERILNEDPANLQVLVENDAIREWVRANEPEIYAEFFDTSPVADAVQKTAAASEGFDIEAYIRRIEIALPNDPALAIGSTKELLESVFKTILGLRGVDIAQEDMPKLLKRTQAALGLDPKDVGSDTPGGDSLRRLLGSLAQIVIAVTELRNLYGTGHGKSHAPGLDDPSANLVVASGIAAATYLMERYRAMRT